MVKPIALNEYYLSPNDVKTIVETTLALYASNMLRKRNMISEGEHNQMLDECARHLAPTSTLMEGSTYGSRKRVYTTNQLKEESARILNQILNEGWLSDTGKWIGDKAEQFGLHKRGDTVGRNVARAFGFEPDEGLSWGNVLNGAITLGSLVAAPFTGGGSLAAGTAARAALGTGARVAANALLRTGAKTLGKSAAKAAVPSLWKGIWTNAGRTALKNQAMKNFGSAAGRKFVANTALKNVGKNLALIHGINAGMNVLGLDGQDASSQGLQQPQYAGGYNPYGDYYGNSYGGYNNAYGDWYNNAYSGGYSGGFDPITQSFFEQQGINPYAFYGMA